MNVPSPVRLELFASPVEAIKARETIIHFRAEATPEEHHGSGTLPRIVPLSLMRQIDRELKSNCCDPRIVHNSCRGLQTGTSDFEDAYIAARIAAYSRREDFFNEPQSFEQPVYVTTLPAIHHVWNNHHLAPSRYSDGVLHGGHLMEHFGNWVIALLAIQLLSACNIGAFANHTLGSGMVFHSVVWLMLMLSLNFAVWLRYYGKPAREFHRPGAGLFVLAILPGFMLHLLMALQAAL
jgi:hypothetical protein